MNELALFAGSGGGILGGRLLGWNTVCAVEIDEYCRKVLLARQRDGHLPRFPIWDDIRTFDGRAWHGKVDIVTGGFPCQDISTAGKGEGITGERSSLWFEMARVIGEVRPRYALVENSPLLISRGLDVVLSDLAAMGYDAKWGVIGAHHAGAPHYRDRLWILADPGGGRCRESEGWEGKQQRGAKAFGPGQDDANPTGAQRERLPWAWEYRERWSSFGFSCGGWWSAEPNVGRVANGVAHRVDRIRAIGDGQVPAVVRLAWNLLSG